MTSPMVLPRRGGGRFAGLLDVRRTSKPTLSWAILAATTLVVAAVLLVWLLLWINRPRTGVAGWWVAQRGLALPVVGHQADDLRRIVRRPSGAGPDEVPYGSLEQVLRQRLSAGAGRGGRPVVLYLSAVGVSDGRGGFLLRPEPGPLGAAGGRGAALSAEALVDLLAQGPARPRLLILDAGQVGSDRDLGLYANGFLSRLRAALEAKGVKGLAVLSSCAPGQVSWTSEADGGSVFGHFVARGMSGGAAGWDGAGRGVTARALYRYVRERVKGWVAANRQAVQTPEWLGDPELDFVLPRTAPAPTPAAAADPAADAALGRLHEGWVRGEALRKRQPYRHTPLAWRQYLATLLRAERLLRAGGLAEAEAALKGLGALEKRVADGLPGLALEDPWSLGLLERHADDDPERAKARAAEVAAAGERIDQALQALVGGAEEAEPPLEEETRAPAGASPKPAEAPAPKKGAAPPDVGARPKATASEAPAARAASRPPRARPKTPAPLSDLLLKGDEVHPRYVEAQVLVWADTFARRGPTPDAFKGARGELLGEALRTRRLAERGAAADERIGRWIAPLVDAGDALRRGAQDGLFAGDGGRFEALARRLGQARDRYRNALEVADRAARALDLVEQVEAEAPYYGDWLAHRVEGPDDGLDPSFVALLKRAAALARRLQGEGPPPVAASGGGDGDDPTAGHLARVRAWEAEARELKAGFDRLREEFQAHCSALAASGGPGRWRAIDAALRVPLVDAETRRQLLQAVRSAPVAGTLAAPGAGEAPAPPSASAAGPGVSEAEGASAADPGFWRVALRLAQMEVGLLEVGGVPEAELAGLATAWTAARDATRGGGDRAFEAFGRLSEALRAARAGRLREALRERGQAPAALAEADRGLRVLPTADTLGLSDKAAEALDRSHRHALLVWHADRLLRDFAPGHARRLLDEARQLGESEPLRAAIEAAGAMERAAIDLKAEPAGTLVVADWSERPLALELAPSGEIPEGEATLLVAFDPAQPVSVAEKGSRSGGREGVLVPVRADRRAERRDYLVGRTESTPEPLALRLSPIAFYRGRVFAAERAVEVTLSRAEDPVAVTVQQSYEGLKFRDFGDQFKEHPGQGYLHFGTDLRYKLVLTADRPLKAVVRYGLKEHPESFKTKTLELGPKKKGEIIDVVRGADFPIVKAEGPEPVLAPLNLAVTVWKDHEGGELQGRARYVFRVIPPSQYISTAAEFDPSTRTLHLWVTHLANDPVTGPVTVIASIGGGEVRALVRRSRIAPFVFQIPTAVKSVTWRVGVESMPNVFRETVETPPPPGATPAQPPPQ